MAGPTSIEGYAIISADGMLADANRHIPPGLVVEADQAFFHGRLEQRRWWCTDATRTKVGHAPTAVIGWS